MCGRADLAADPRFIDIPSRRQNLAALTEALDAHFATRTTDDWQAFFAGQVPFAPVRNLAEALENPFVREVGMRDTIDHPDRSQGLDMLACPIRINGRRAPGIRAPKLGEHTAALTDALP